MTVTLRPGERSVSFRPTEVFTGLLVPLLDRTRAEWVLIAESTERSA